MNKPGWSASILPTPDPLNGFKVVHSSNNLEVSVKMLDRPQSALPGTGSRLSRAGDTAGEGSSASRSKRTSNSSISGTIVNTHGGKRRKDKQSGKKQTLAVADEQIRTLQKLGEDFARKTHELKDKMDQMVEEKHVLEKEIVQYRKSMGGNEVSMRT